MPKFAITVNEKVNFEHLLIVECDTLDEAEILADDLADERFDHIDDVPYMASELGAKVVEMQEDYYVETDEIEIEDVEEYEESEEK